MHQLILLRHAKSSWDNPDSSDFDRPLNPRGRRAAGLVRGAMRQLGLAPDMVLTSPAKRTLETLSLLEPWDDTPLIEEVPSLYLASLEQLLAVLNGVADTTRSVMLVGHNPGLHELALSLAAPASDALAGGFPSGALAEFSVAVPWSRLAAGGGRLVRLLTPRMLEAS